MSKISWTAGFFKWASQWSQSTLRQARSLRRTSFWILSLHCSRLHSSRPKLISKATWADSVVFRSIYFSVMSIFTDSYSYEWIVPINWMKAEVQQSRFWLLERTGMNTKIILFWWCHLVLSTGSEWDKFTILIHISLGLGLYNIKNNYLYVAFHDDMKTTGNEWVLVNLNITGYYRVNYDTENWERLLNQLTENHEVKTLVLGVMHYK